MVKETDTSLQDETLAETQVAEDFDVIDDLDELTTESEDISGEEELQEETPQDEVEHQPEKTSNWQNEDFKKAWENAQKLIGRQGQELGELRKKVESLPTAELKTPEQTIKVMPDSELENSIAYLESVISKPNAQYDDEDYGKNIVIFNKLNQEKTRRLVEASHQSNNAQTHNKQIIAEFENAWKANLSDEDRAQVVKFAQDRLSDQYGNITASDLEVALHKVFPDQYKQSIKLGVTEQTRKRIEKAEATIQPRLSGAGNSQASESLSLKKIMAMDADEQRALFAKLPPKTLNKIIAAMQKT